MANSLYPGFVKIGYTVKTRPHHMIVPVQPYQDVAGDWWLSEKDDGIGQLWLTAIQGLQDKINPMYNTTDYAIQGAELWTLDSPDADPVFQESGTLSTTGTVGTASIDYGQIVFTWRSVDGGIIKLYLMESIFNPNVKAAAPSYGGNTAKQNLNTYMTSTGAVVSGRDGSFASVGLFSKSKTSDALRKKYIMDV